MTGVMYVEIYLSITQCLCADVLIVSSEAAELEHLSKFNLFTILTLYSFDLTSILLIFEIFWPE